MVLFNRNSLNRGKINIPYQAIVIKLVGQSNTEGYVYPSTFDDLPSHLRNIDDCYICNAVSGQYGGAFGDHPVRTLRDHADYQMSLPGDQKYAIGIEFHLAYLLKEYTGKPVYISKCARGGTGMYNKPGYWNWNVEADPEMSLYLSAKDTYTQLVKHLQSNGITYKTVALILHQGEEDALSDRTGEYYSNLAPCMNGLVDHIGNPLINKQLVGIAARGNQYDGSKPQFEAVRNGHKQYVTTTYNSDYNYFPQFLNDSNDGLHFSLAGQGLKAQAIFENLKSQL